MPSGIRPFPALRLVNRLNGNLFFTLLHTVVLDAWMLKAGRQRPPDRTRLKIYIRIEWIFLPLAHNMIHYC